MIFLVSLLAVVAVYVAVRRRPAPPLRVAPAELSRLVERQRRAENRRLGGVSWTASEFEVVPAEEVSP